MPKLSSLLASTGTIEIPTPDDEPLVVVYRSDVMTPRLQAEFIAAQATAMDNVASAQKAVDFLCGLVCRVVVEWNMTDDDGIVIPLTREAVSDVTFAALDLILSEIGRQRAADPLKHSGSRNGSLATAGSEPLLITTGS
jgi:hypothetical protein